MVGAPQAPELHESYKNALKILAKVPIEHEIVSEEAATGFADTFGKLVAEHERTS